MKKRPKAASENLYVRRLNETSRC